MRDAFRKELWRSISSNAARFVAIAGIVALGCGFFAGLGMAGRDMRLSADAFYDGTHLYDLRVLSTMGLGEGQVELVRGVEGVERVMPGHAADVMATLNDERYAMRIMSVDVDAAAASKTDERGVVVSSDDDAYLNRLVLATGAWPSSPDECVLSADRVMGTPIQVGDEVEVLYGTAPLDDVLEVRRFTVSGLVHSSAFVSSTTLGYTNLGSGVIQQYLFVPEEAFSEELPYTELFVTVQGAADELSASDAYQELVDEVAARIEALPLAQARLDEVRGDAQAELDDATREFEEERDDAWAQLDDAQAQLDDALAQLEDARAQIAEGQAELDAGAAELADARRTTSAQLADARAKLDDAQRTIEAGERALKAGQAELDANRTKLEQGEAELAQRRAQWEAAKPALQEAAAGRPQLVEGIAQAQDGLAQLDAGIDQARTGMDQLDQALQAIDQLEAQAAALEAQLEGADDETRALLEEQLAAIEAQLGQLGDRAALEAQREAVAGQLAGLEAQRGEVATTLEGLQAQLETLDGQLAAQGVDPENIGAFIEQSDKALADGATELSSARTQLEAGQATLDEQASKLADARSQLERGRSELARQEASANEQLAQAQRELDEGAAELADARVQLADGEREYQEGLEEYRSSRSEVDERLADAAAQLAEAQADIDELELPDVYVLDRTKNSGTASYQDDSQRIDAIARVFPLIFFLVAALVSLTTMTRMVEDERIEIGTHKALGFSTARITSKYVAYAALAGVVGSVVGILVLSQVLPLVVMVAYAIIYNVPLPAFPLSISVPISLLSSGLGVGVTLVATAAAAAATLAENPASLMLPKAPAAGKRILLERIAPLWSRVSFSWKVTLRNLFRFKRRLAMTLIGIAGCTALLLTGLGLHDSIWDIIAKQFEGDDPITRYTVVVGMDEDGNLDTVEDVIAHEGGAQTFARVDTANVQVASEAHPTPMAVSEYVPQDADAFLGLVSLRERVSGEPLAFGDDAVVLTEKAATRLGVSVGDTIYVYEQDDIGNAAGEPVPLVLTGVSENYIYHYLYVGPKAQARAMGAEPKADAVLADIPDDADVRSRVAEVLSDMDDVSTVTFNTEQIDSYRKSLRSVNMVVVVLVVAAAALVFIVLYNLTNIQLIERTREIASLKVLGFDRREVAAYLFRETLLLVCLGALVGLGLGVIMESFVVVTAEVDVVMFGREIHALSFVIAFVLTIAFSLVVMATLLPKLRRIDMVESLKSVD